MRTSFTFDDRGNIIGVDHPELRAVLDEEFGTVERWRASHVEPINFILRQAFRFLRACVRDESIAADWSRRWSCRWQANLALSGGPVLAPFINRQEAIDADRR